MNQFSSFTLLPKTSYNSLHTFFANNQSSPFHPYSILEHSSNDSISCLCDLTKANPKDKNLRRVLDNLMGQAGLTFDPN